MKRFKLLSSSLATLAILCSACDSGQTANDPAADLASDQRPAAGEKVAEIIDRKLDTQGLARTGGFKALLQACEIAGGTFNASLVECLCPNGALFTTGTPRSSCLKVRLNSVNAEIENPGGVYGSVPHTLSFDPYTMSKQRPISHPLLSDVTTAERMKTPFRLSIFGWQAVNFEFDDERKDDVLKTMFDSSSYASPEETFEAFYGVMLGHPLVSGSTHANDGFVMYEPNRRFIASALGYASASMSAEDMAQFSSLKLEDNSALSVALRDAYSAFRKLQSFSPDEVHSPYRSGCASYCVASMPIELSESDAGYIATYKKVYQMGTPSTRLIVLRDSKFGNLAAVISLNVADTVSTVNWIEIKETDQPELSITTYDRNGKFLYWHSNAFQSESELADTLQYLN